MDLELLRQTAEHAGMAALAASFIAGFLFSINPVAIAAIPVSLAYVTKAREKHTALLFGGMFILGLIVTHLLLGLAAGIGSPLWETMMLFAFALGRSIPIAIGACALGWLENLKALARHQRAFDTLGGIALIAAGLYLLNAFFLFVPSLAG